MTPLRCLSSHLMTKLLTFRNSGANNENVWLFRTRLITTEIGLSILIVTSVIESFAYTTLAIIFLALSPICTDKPRLFFAKLENSSLFTFYWGIADLIYNLFFQNIITHESDARYFARALGCYRDEDYNYIIGLLEISQTPLDPPLYIEEGANFIKAHFFKEQTQKNLELFKESSPFICLFLSTKAVYIYAFGPKKTEPLPNFFKKQTLDSIKEFRKMNIDKKIAAQLEELMKGPQSFDPESYKQELGEESTETIEQSTETIDQSKKNILNRLKGVASEELQGGELFSKCYPKALDSLDI